MQLKSQSFIEYSRRQTQWAWKSTKAEAQSAFQRLQESFWNAGSTLNKVTGYDLVQERKNRVLEKDKDVIQKREEFKLAKEEYERLIELGKQMQRDLDHLRERKRIQSIDDINQITKLYESLLSIESQEKDAKEKYQKATEGFEKAQVEYLNEMRERYVEEQMFSDKIRQTSTWWTWGLISTHLFLFLVINLIIEPQKRRKLKQEMQEMIQEASMNEQQMIETLMARHFNQNRPLDAPIITASPPVVESPALLWSVMNNTAFWQGMFIGAVVALGSIFIK
jgi:sensitive to high expression protein 9